MLITQKTMTIFLDAVRAGRLDSNGLEMVIWSLEIIRSDRSICWSPDSKILC